MHRRQVLHALTAGGVLAAGCLSHPTAIDRTTEPQSRSSSDGKRVSICRSRRTPP